MNNSKARQSGFSLIEMMVTVIIMGIVLAIAVGAYGDLRERTRVDAAKETIVSTLSQARLMAVSQGVDQPVAFDFTNDSLTDALGQNRSFDVNVQKFVCSTCTASEGTDTITFKPRGSFSSSSVKVSSPSSGSVFYIVVQGVTGSIDVRTSCVSGVCQ